MLIHWTEHYINNRMISVVDFFIAPYGTAAVSSLKAKKCSCAFNAHFGKKVNKEIGSVFQRILSYHSTEGLLKSQSIK